LVTASGGDNARLALTMDAKLKRDLADIKRSLAQMKWMAAAVLALEIATLVKLFQQ
jgi:hypothetical protein